MLSIDEAKVQQLINASTSGYSVTASHLVAIPLKYEIPKTTVYTVDFTPPAEMIDPEKYFSELRERVIASGITLKSPQEIDREIDEMRRHGL
jgi:hypothetical protein